MISTFFIGITLLIVAGIFGGSWAAPLKRLRQYQFEHWLFVCAVFGLLFLPWIATLIIYTNPISALCKVPLIIILKANACSVAWGIANILFAHCLIRIGFSLTYGIMTGVGLPIGVLVPMVIKGSGKFADAPSILSLAGIVAIIGTLLMVFSVFFTALAGYRRESHESKPQRKFFIIGLLLAVLIGVLQIGMAFAFIYSQGPITEALFQQGKQPMDVSIAVWAVSLPGGALINIIYSLYIMTRNKTYKTLKNFKDLSLVFIAGFGLFTMMSLMGIGMRYLGALGSSVGFGIVQAFQIMSSQVVGFKGGEWQRASRSSKTMMLASIIIMIIAIVVMAFAKSISK